MGTLEEKVLRGELAYAASLPRLPEDEERIVLLAMHQALIEPGLCLRDHDPEAKRPTLLVFPSYYGRERPDLEGHPTVFVSYRFSGFLDDIYATLVVRLHHTQPFRKQIPFDGERFDVMSVRRWRDRVLGSSLTPAGG